MLPGGDESLLPSSVAIAGKSRALDSRFVKGRKCFRFISTLDEATASGRLWADGDGRQEQALLFECRVGGLRVDYPA